MNVAENLLPSIKEGLNEVLANEKLLFERTASPHPACFGIAIGMNLKQ